MITDWNSPQGDFDPTEKQGELLMLLSGQQVTVHTSAEDDFDYMENEDVAFVVKNPHSEEDLLIELCGEFSVFFEKWHGEYPATEEGYAQMTRDVQAVLAGSAGALSLYTEDGWQGCPSSCGSISVASPSKSVICSCFPALSKLAFAIGILFS